MRRETRFMRHVHNGLVSQIESDGWSLDKLARMHGVEQKEFDKSRMRQDLAGFYEAEIEYRLQMGRSGLFDYLLALDAVEASRAVGLSLCMCLVRLPEALGDHC